MSRGATARYRHLQKTAFHWALDQGFRVAALDVRVAQIRARLDVAACKFEPPRKVRGANFLKAGPVVVFECKSDRADFLRDTRSEEQLREQLKGLHARRFILEESLRRDFPTLREGETLFPEYDVYRFENVGGSPYQELLGEIYEVSRQLYSKSKFAKMLRWKGANLYYIVAEEGIADPSELPAGWGLIEQRMAGAAVVVKAVWQDAPDANRWLVAARIAMAATNALESKLSSELKHSQRWFGV
jgi:hypothetical protein